MINPKTITTFLISGNPSGIKTIFVSNKICKALFIPRTDVDQVKHRDEASRPSLYFLINQEDESLYIGESENFYERLKSHVSNKEFWGVAIQFFSQNNDLTKADVKYLEFLSFIEAESAGNIKLEENKQKPSCPHLPEHQKAMIEEFFEDVKLITGFLNYNFFKKIEKKENNELFYCKRNGIDAKGFYQDGIFTILSGSKITKDSYKSTKGSAGHLTLLEKIQRAKDNIILEEKGRFDCDFIIITKDIQCDSPSIASNICIGNASNGWTEWKNKDGATLDDVFRKRLD